MWNDPIVARIFSILFRLGVIVAGLLIALVTLIVAAGAVGAVYGLTVAAGGWLYGLYP